MMLLGVEEMEHNGWRAGRGCEVLLFRCREGGEWRNGFMQSLKKKKSCNHSLGENFSGRRHPAE